MTLEEQIELVENLRDNAKRIGDTAGTRLAALWNPETRRYEPHEDMIAYHAIVNDALVQYMKLDRMAQNLRFEGVHLPQDVVE